MNTNEQNLPPGIPNGQQAQGQAQAPQEPVPTPSPMLSHVSQVQEPVVAPPPTEHLTPVEPPAEAQKPKPEPKAVQHAADLVGDLAQDAYAKPAITYLENACQAAEVDLARAFSKAVEYGDAGLIDAAYLQDKLGDGAKAVIDQATALFEYSSSKAAETINTVYQAVGGEEVLKQAAQHFNQAASAEERAEIAYLLDSGNKELMKRAAERIVQYGKQGGTVYSPQGQPLGNPSTAQGLSKEDYIKAISNPRLSTQDYDKLREQRKLGRAQGLN